MITFDPPSLEDVCNKEVLLQTIEEEAKIKDPENMSIDLTIVATMEVDLSLIAFRRIPSWMRGEEELPHSIEDLGELHGSIARRVDCIDHIGKNGTYHIYWYVC